MAKFLYPKHPVCCIITGFSCCGKSVFLTISILNIINEYDKIFIDSSLYQELHQKIIKSFSNYIANNIIPNILIEKDLDLVIREIVNVKDFENQTQRQRHLNQ